MKKVKCHTCGYFSIMYTEAGYLKHCNAMTEFLRSENPELFKDHMTIITKSNEYKEAYPNDKPVGLEIVAVDTSFILNKNNNCEFWITQDRKQKEDLKKYNRLRRRAMFVRFFKRVFGK